MEDIKEIFKEKQFDAKTLQCLENAINEFDELFGKYFSRQEVINRIKDRIHRVIWKEGLAKKEKCFGEWTPSSGTIRIDSNLSRQRLGDVFFHELIHAIRTDDHGNIGFTRTYEIDGFDYKLNVGNAIEEGFTQYVTNIRNKKFRNIITGNGYKIEEDFLSIFEIDRDRLLEIGFTAPHTIREEIALAMGGSTSLKNITDVTRLLSAMDARLFYEHDEEKTIEEKESYMRDIWEIVKSSYISIKGGALKSPRDLCNSLIICNELSMFFALSFDHDALELRLNSEDVFVMLNEIARKGINIDEAVKELREGEYNYLSNQLAIAKRRQDIGINIYDEHNEEHMPNSYGKNYTTIGEEYDR